ncbi:MAG: hypothetical protein FWC71_08835 [Defluviitaleaceae bacterium]|nr:hypothetical protein [Defluviitaleaceae bacterium]
MNKKCAGVLLIVFTIITLLISLNACGYNVEENNVNINVVLNDGEYNDINDNIEVDDLYESACEVEGDAIYDHILTNDSYRINNEIEINNANMDIVLTVYDQYALDANVFIGDSTKNDQSSYGEIGGDSALFYFRVFGVDFHWISGIFIDHVSFDAFEGYLDVLRTYRRMNPLSDREFALRDFFMFFELSKHDVISILEDFWGKSMDEMDALIADAREVVRTSPQPGAEPWERVAWAHHRFSSCDLTALFSNDVTKMWAAFPGEGIYYNGQAFSPQWIMQNMYEAIVERQLPLEEIERVFNIINQAGFATEYFPELTSAMEIFIEESESRR